MEIGEISQDYMEPIMLLFWMNSRTFFNQSIYGMKFKEHELISSNTDI